MVNKNKKGWTEVLEVFFAIILLTGVMMIILNSVPIKKENKGEKIYLEQENILRDIQLNDSLRTEVLNESEENISKFIKKNIANYLECNVTISSLDNNSILEKDKEMYVSSVYIFVEGSNYNPKKLKLSCWEKN